MGNQHILQRWDQWIRFRMLRREWWCWKTTPAFRRHEMKLGEFPGCVADPRLVTRVAIKWAGQGVAGYLPASPPRPPNLAWPS